MAKRRPFPAGPDAAFDSGFAGRSSQYPIFQPALIVPASRRPARRSRLESTLEYQQDLSLLVKQRMQDHPFLTDGPRTGSWAQPLFTALFHSCIFVLPTFPTPAPRLSQSSTLIHRRHGTTKRRPSHNALYRAFLRILPANGEEPERSGAHTTSLPERQ